MRDWVLRKRGLFYRPDYCGYTSSIHDAGRYTEADAKERASAGIEPPVTAHHESEFPDGPTLLALAVRAEGIINELARLGRCPVILRALAVDLREAIANEQKANSQ